MLEHVTAERINTELCKLLVGQDAGNVLRLTMLLHDIGKPNCRSTDEKGITTSTATPR